MTDVNTQTNASAAGTFKLGGDLSVNRLGFGAMRITGQGIWGEPPDPDGARHLLRRAVELGVNLIDTADAYGPGVSERLIAEALHPYPDDLIIATKGGIVKTGPGQFHPDGRPEHLRAACEASLQRLRKDRIDLYQLHTVDPQVSIEESIRALAELQSEGKIRHIGICNVSTEQLRRAQKVTKIVSVQNKYNLADRTSDDVLAVCEREGLGFIPWYPLATGSLASSGGPLEQAAARHQATPGQLAIAWLLLRSPVMLPIPGTSSVKHLEENIAAAALKLSNDQLAALAN